MDTKSDTTASADAGEPAPGAKIHAMQFSVASYVCSLMGLVPVVGLPFALAATVMGRLARRKSRSWANPAERYARAASWIGPAGFLVTLMFVFVVSGIWRELGSGGGGGG